MLVNTENLRAELATCQRQYDIKTQSPQQQFVRLARKSSQSGDFELLSISAVQKTEQGFHHNQFPKI